MAEQIELKMLSMLPDVVKRKILSSLESIGCEHNSPQGLPSCGSRRVVQLPPLRPSGVCIVDGVLSPAETSAVAQAVEGWLCDHGRRPGMGSRSSGGLWHDMHQRGDITSWVSEQELQAAGQALLSAVLQLLASLRHQLLQQGYDVSGRCSVQLACYPGGGARYVRHADASPALPDRSITALLYVNNEWDVQVDGGQLALYNAAHTSLPLPAVQAAATPIIHVGYQAGEPATLVAPIGGRLVVFDSRLEHEVLPAHKDRYSISAFFYQGKPQTAGAATSKCADAAADLALTTASSPAVVNAAFKEIAGHAASGRMQAPKLQPTVAEAPIPAVLPSPEALTHLCAPGATPPLPRIFVSIASFRDDECQWTLRDLFLKATQPQRVFVGVVWQIDPLTDHAFVRMAGGDKTEPYLKQLREVRVHYETATGPCAARSIAQQLWAGEEYVLQVDAHMRFVEGWDELCLQQLQLAQQEACQERVVLSTYPLGYHGEGPAAAVPENAPATLLCAKCFDDSGLLRIQSRSLACRPPRPVPSLFWAAGFSFAPAALLLEVPYCPHLPYLFFGEESYMLARMVTRGWQVWAPNQPVLFHQWERSARANHYQASVPVHPAKQLASQAQVLEVLRGMEPGALPELGEGAGTSACVAIGGSLCMQHTAISPCRADWAPGGLWGLGTALTMEELETRHGINFRKLLVSTEAQYGGQPLTAFT